MLGVEVEVEILDDTDGAYLVRLDEDSEEEWIPKSQILDVIEEVVEPDTGEIVMMTLELPEWLAIKKGLV